MMKWTKDEYSITDDQGTIDFETVFRLLSQTYWAAHRPQEQIRKSFAHSLVLGVYHGERQVGMVRTVTDYATFSWICDVVIDPDYRGRGLGKWMIACLLEHPAIQGTNLVLGTRDAHGLYTRFGFEEREMLRRIVAVGDNPHIRT